jgi:(2Fe-2S) ferredoxin
VKRYRGHFIACSGKDCRKAGGGKRLLKSTKKLLGKDARFTKCSTVKCLGACKHAPVLIAYPLGLWLRCPDDVALEQVVAAYRNDESPPKKLILLDMGQLRTQAE